MKKLLLMMLTLIIMGFIGFAQDGYESVTVGNSTTQGYYAGFAGWYGFTWSVNTYKADELNLTTGSNIMGLAWNFYSVESPSGANSVSIYIKEISEDGVAGSTIYADFKADAQLCYSGSMGFMHEGWSYLELSDPYQYQGGNLVIIAESEGCSLYGGCTKQIYYTSQANTDMAWTFFQDGSNMNASSSFSTLSGAYNSDNHYRPDVKVYYEEGSVSCSPVQSLTVVSSEITSNSAAISWTEPESAGDYLVLLKTSSQSWDSEDIITYTTNDTYFSFSDLSPATTYNVRVINDCGDEQSVPRNITFTTACGAISLLPYSINFDDVATLPNCWSALNQYEGYPMVSSTYPYNNSTQSLEFHANGASYAVLPAFEAPLSELQVSLYTCREGSSSGSFQVGYLTDPSDANTFIALETVTSAGLGNNDYIKLIVSYQDAEVDEDARIAFKYINDPSYNNWYWFVDDVEVDNISPCPEPLKLKVAGYGLNSVDLTWEAGETTDFSLFYKTSTETEFTEITGVSLDENGIYTLENTLPSTTYTWYVIAHCDIDVQSDSTSFTTPCEGISELPQTWDMEENNTGGTSGNPLPACWIRSTVSANVPYVYNYQSYAHSGNRTIYFSSTANISASITPINTEVLNISDIQLKFYARSSSTTTPAQLMIGVMSNPEDHTTFDTVDIVTLGSTYQLYEVPFDSYQGNKTFISFKFTGNTSLYVDDVTLENIPECPKPTGLASTQIEETTFDLSWNSTGDNFNLYYKKAADEEWEVIENLSETTYTLSDLDMTTNYEWYVGLVCSDTIMASLIATFSTPCGLMPLTYTQDFESVIPGQIPDCWSQIYPYDGYPKATTSYPHESSTKAMEFRCPSANTSVYAVLPQFEETIDQLQISFWTRREGANSGTLSLGYMTNTSDTSTFTQIWSMSSEQIGDNSYHYYELNFGGIQLDGDDANIVFRYNTPNAVWYWFVDDITVELIPSCPSPVSLAASNITANSATLTWSSLADEFNVYYKGENDAEYTVMENVSLDEEGFIIEDLSPASTYIWYVEAICSDTTVASTATSFTTACDAITALPYFNNFENTPVNTLPICWSQINPTSNNYPKVTNYSAYNSNNKLEFRNNYNSNTPTFAVLPLIDADLSELQISFWHRKEGTSSGTFSVGYMTDPSNANTFVELWSTNGSTASSAYTLQTVEFASLAEEEDYDSEAELYIAFKYNCSSNWYWYVDDVTVEPVPACPAPTDLSTVAVASSSANLAWSNSSDNMNLYYKKSSETEWTTIEGITYDTESVYTLENLEPSTTYDWKVGNICEDGSITMSIPGQFTTACAAYEAPFLEEFTANTLPDCWKRYTGNADQVFNGGQMNPASNGWNYSSSDVFENNTHYYLNIYGTGVNHWLVTPDIDLSNLTTPALSFDLALTKYASSDPISQGQQSDDKFIVAVSTDGGLTWNAANAIVWDNSGSIDYSYDNISNTGETVYIPLTQYANQTIKIAFYGESTIDGGDNNLHIDNVSVDEMPTCMPPKSLLISEITDNSATVTWVPQGQETAWIFEYKEAGETDWEEMTVTTTEAQLTGLTTLTYYDVRVKADCGDETSTYVSGSFVTICGAENQCTYSIEMTDEYGDGWNDCEIIVTQNGVERAILTINDGGDETPITETFNLCDGIETEILWIPGSYPEEIGFTIYDPNGNVILQKAEGSMEDADLEIVLLTFTTDCQGSGPAECVVPTALAVNVITETAATATWTAGGNETAWKLQYKTAAATSWGSEIAVNTTPSYQMTGLAAGTAYQVRVKAVCGEGDESDWTEAVAFTTNEEVVEPCNTPTNVAASNITKESMTITWNANGASKWNLQYRVVNGAWSTVTVEGNPTYTITDLTEATEYQIQVQAVCDGATSPWSTMISQSTGINARLMGSISLYPNPASNYVDVRVSDNDIAVSRLEVYDVYGKLINEVEVINNPTRINVENLASGMYFVKVITNDGVATKNFIKK